MRSMVYCLGIATMLLFFSCCRQRSVVSTCVSDTTVIEHPVRHVPASDTMSLIASLRCDSLGRVYVAHLNQLASENYRLRFSLDSLGCMTQEVVHVGDTVYLPRRTESIRHTSECVTQPPSRSRLQRWYVVAMVAMGVGVVMILRRR